MYYAVFILILFSSVGFFNYHGMLSDQMQRAIFYACSCVGLFLALTERRVKLRDVEYPRYAYWTVIGSILVSILMVNMYHGQPLVQSLITTLPYIFSYLFLYVLIKFQFSEKYILRIFMVACLLSVPVYFGNLFAFPNQMFGIANSEGADFSRGILRVYVVFIEVFVLILFYAIYRWRQDRKTLWMLWIILCVVMIALSVTRQIIIVSFLLAILYGLDGAPLRKKIMILVAAAVIGGVLVPRIPMFKTMIELSDAQAQINEDKEDVRIRAWRYYTYENQDNVETVLFGNGVPALGVSAYGIVFQQDADETGCLLVDVGWAGFFYLFGLIGTIALLVLLSKSMREAYRNGRSYVLYWLVFIAITAVASGPILFYYQVIIVMTGVYLAYIPNEEDGADNTELQQC